jgi:SAM-dependent methyltransferase
MTAGEPALWHETSKVRDRVLPLLLMAGPKGADLGPGGLGEPVDKITPDAIGVDLAPSADVVHDLNHTLPFKAGELDWIWSSHCLEHLHNWTMCLVDWWRCLKSGGVLGLYLPHEAYYDNAWNRDHKHYFNERQVADWMRENLAAIILRCELDVDDVPLSARPERHVQTGRYSFLVIAQKPERGVNSHAQETAGQATQGTQAQAAED